MVNTVEDIKINPFRFRSLNERIRILLEDKPRPRLVRLQFLDPKLCSPKALTWVNFDVAKYDQIHWLTGCEKEQALFCWPCLLFNGHPNMWNTCGVKEKKITTAIEEHETYVQHIQAMFEMQMFLRQNSVNNSVSDVFFNELVRRNREILKRVIDVVCLLITQKQPPREGSRDRNQLKIEDCLDTLHFLRDYDSLGDNIIDDALDLLQISPNVMTDVIEAMTGLVKTEIMKEVQQSTFVSMILSVHGSNETKSQLSTVLRYLKNSSVCERFVGFQYFDGKNFRTYMDIFHHVKNVATEFQIKQKLLSVTFDGGLPITKFVMDQLLKAFPSSYPHMTFVPCYFHKLHYVLQQSVSMWNNCDCFFKTLKEIGCFIQQNSERQTEFQNAMASKRYPVKTFDFGSSSDSLTYLKFSRKHFIEFFNSTENFIADDFAKVLGYCQFLSDIKTLFFIDVFIRLFSFTGDLNQVLNSEVPEDLFENDMISKCISSLDNEKKGGFKSLWKGFIKNRDNEVPSNVNDEEDFYRALHLDIVECVLYQIKIRVGHLNRLKFFHLLNPAKISTYSNYDILTSKLSTLYGSEFSVPLVKQEVDMLHDFYHGCIQDKSVEQMLKLFMQKRFDIFIHLKKLAELILTLPFKPPKPEYVCIMDKINTWSCPGKGTGDISLLCIEQYILLKLRNKFSFHDEVILKFHEKNQTLDMLDYKR